MARRCTTVPGYGLCCTAAQQNRLNQPIRINTTRGQRCGICSTHPSTSRNPLKAGKTVFQFRFAPGASCGLGSGGCPVLGQGGAVPGQTTLLPAGGGGTTLILP